jgi:ATP-dependent helicase/nuclease subunit A
VNLDVAQRERIARAALAVIADASLAPLFGPRSAPEVEIVARLMGARGEIAVTGRIDRLAETETEAIIADFKTGAPRDPPSRTQLRQLAVYRAAASQLYPGKTIRCVLVFTETATIMEPGAGELDAALDEVLTNL